MKDIIRMSERKINKLVEIAWFAYKNKVANKMINPYNEKMMQLQFSFILQTCSYLFEFKEDESIKILLEYYVDIPKGKKSIDIVIVHREKNQKIYYPIELKCFRLSTQEGSGRRGAQNLGMYDYWDDIESLEQYLKHIKNFKKGFQLTITDDRYYVETHHSGKQVKVYSTYKGRENITGNLYHPIANRKGNIFLRNKYSMNKWEKIEDFYFVKQEIT